MSNVTVRARLALAVTATAFVVACSGGVSTHDRAVDTRAPRSEISSSQLPASPADVVAPRDADAVAATLTRVERAIRANEYDAARSPAWGWQQQVAYGALAAHPEWLERVLVAVPADLRRPVRATHAAGAALSAPDLGHAPVDLPDEPAEYPDWTIRTPRPPDELLRMYREAEATFAIPWQYLAAIHFVETKTGRIHGNSTTGAQGPMQFMPSTWAAYGAGGDIHDDHDAILAAARSLSASGGPADMRQALLAYNPSDAYVAAITGYAEVMIDEPRAFHGFHAWQVFIGTAHGDELLPEGWTRPS